MTDEQKNITAEVKRRLEQVKKNCFKTPNPYYVKGQFPNEYQDLKLKISELEKVVSKPTTFF